MPVRLAHRSRGLRAAGLIVAALVVLLLALPGVAAAKDSSARKLGRGASNVALGVAALPREIYWTTRERGPFLGATWGFAKGVAWTAITEVVGVWEVVTCPFQMPRDWKPIIDPEFPWQGFTEAQHAARGRRKAAQKTLR
ncbi:MAG: exosortase system-associated protein, TIGR04073 family [Spirochaetaceae bacterium]|nr:exosortase system-associated protein, TIGR04073 family [Myxococcales bacterium]MCB9724168.1 exosortase system-associated protein, TIGR04073 family [Spirochaetaceae bacterium]